MQEKHLSFSSPGEPQIPVSFSSAPDSLSAYLRMSSFTNESANEGLLALYSSKMLLRDSSLWYHICGSPGPIPSFMCLICHINTILTILGHFLGIPLCFYGKTSNSENQVPQLPTRAERCEPVSKHTETNTVLPQHRAGHSGLSVKGRCYHHDHDPYQYITQWLSLLNSALPQSDRQAPSFQAHPPSVT